MDTATVEKPEVKKQYYSKPGGISNQGAQEVGEEFDNIIETHGYLTYPIVIKEAEKKNSCLNKYFTWDNKQAGELYRKQEYYHLIRSIHVKIIVEQEEVKIREYFPIKIEKEDKENKYIKLDKIMSEDEYSNQWINNASGELQAFKTKYENIMKVYVKFRNRFQPVFEEIEKVI